jgi:hypothetical protein
MKGRAIAITSMIGPRYLPIAKSDFAAEALAGAAAALGFIIW